METERVTGANAVAEVAKATAVRRVNRISTSRSGGTTAVILSHALREQGALSTREKHSKNDPSRLGRREEEAEQGERVGEREHLLSRVGTMPLGDASKTWRETLQTEVRMNIWDATSHARAGEAWSGDARRVLVVQASGNQSRRSKRPMRRGGSRSVTNAD